jgi:hypothetical protein
LTRMSGHLNRTGYSGAPLVKVKLRWLTLPVGDNTPVPTPLVVCCRSVPSSRRWLNQSCLWACEPSIERSSMAAPVT